jgi:hypothetical protein
VHATFQRRSKSSSAQIANFWRLCRDQAAIMYPLEIFWRLNALLTPYCKPNVVHAWFAVHTSPASRILRLFEPFGGNRLLFPFCLRYFKRLNALLTPHYTPNVVWTPHHMEYGARLIHRPHKFSSAQIAIFWRLWRKQAVISLLFEMFRRLHATFTPYYTSKVAHACSSVETNQVLCQMQSFKDFTWDLPLFLSRWRYFAFWRLLLLHIIRRMLSRPALRKSRNVKTKLEHATRDSKS